MTIYITAQHINILNVYTVYFYFSSFTIISVGFLLYFLHRFTKLRREII